MAIGAINELEAELNTTGEKHVAQVRDYILKEWTKVEKVRLVTPAHVGNRSKADLSRLKEHFDAHIDAVKVAFADWRQALLSRSQAKRQS